MEEIDEIQQRTIKEMHNLNEQAILSSTKKSENSSLEKEISSMKVTVREIQHELDLKNSQNDRLSLELVNAERKVINLTRTIEENNSLPSAEQYEAINYRKSAKLLNTKEQNTHESITNVFHSKLCNTYDLLKQMKENLLEHEENK